MPKASKAGKHKADSPARETQTAATAISGRPLHQSKEMSNRTRIISLVVGDIICFLIFASLGSSQHGEGVNIVYSLWIALPFIVAWFLVSPFIGAFRAEIATRPKRMAIRTVLSWLATWPVAMLFRWLLVDRVKVPATSAGEFLSFALIALLFNMALLLLWRWPFSLNNSLRQREA
jgi:hypothetical protein